MPGLCWLLVCFIISVHFCVLSKMWNFKYGHSHFPFNYPFLWNSCASPSLLLVFTVCLITLLLVSLCRALTISGSSQGTCCAWLTLPPHLFLRPAPGFLLWILLIIFLLLLVTLFFFFNLLRQKLGDRFHIFSFSDLADDFFSKQSSGCILQIVSSFKILISYSEVIEVLRTSKWLYKPSELYSQVP